MDRFFPENGPVFPQIHPHSCRERQKNERRALLGRTREPVPHERRADASPLVLGSDSQGAKDLHLDQSARRVEQACREHYVPDDLPAILGDNREAQLRRYGVAQGIDKLGHNAAMIAKRPPLQLAHRVAVIGTFGTYLHPCTITTGRGHAHDFAGQRSRSRNSNLLRPSAGLRGHVNRVAVGLPARRRGRQARRCPPGPRDRSAQHGGVPAPDPLTPSYRCPGTDGLRFTSHPGATRRLNSTTRQTG